MTIADNFKDISGLTGIHDEKALSSLYHAHDAHSTPITQDGIAKEIIDSEFRPKRIICIPIDDSSASQNTIDYAIENILTIQDQIILLNCRKINAGDYEDQTDFGTVKETSYGPEPTLKGYHLKVSKKIQTESHKLLGEAAIKFKKHGLYHVRAISHLGNHSDDIEEKIHSLKPSLVIVGARDLNSFSRVMLGSVSEHLVHHLRLPVLVVPFVSTSE